ncbi:MAG: NADH-quinone oxidoreductase subunit L [Methanomassiliicoccales archaeon]|nr:NADH-quinone oxidoreductase subunit L [Methanomassiliicoccales archaeon]
MSILEYAWLIPVLPLLAFVIVGFLGGKMKDSGHLVALIGVGGGMVLALWTAFELLTTGTVYRDSMDWVVLSSDYTIEMGIFLDNVAAMMLIVVSFISFLVVVYSKGYMHDQGKRQHRYFTEICLFVGVMLGLVLANNFLQMFIFWELVGLCSYLLIGFWFERPAAARAAKKAFLVTRVGDVMFMIGLFLLFTELHTLNYELVWASLASADQTTLAFAAFFLFGGAIGKSAQFPLHDWLPDAMEGPTTVSALIHAATMVNAGVYLVARAFPIIATSAEVSLFVAAIGGITAFIAATMALCAPKIKGVLAYSTVSQLGYMILALGSGAFLWNQGHELAGSLAFGAGLFHLMNHAFFKGMLFLGAGSVIHFVGTENLNEMGGLGKYMKVTSITMLISSLSIAGIPVLSGFWSKDEVLAVAFEAGDLNLTFMLLWVLGVATAFMTAFYMFRMWFMAFKGEEKEGTRRALAHGHHAHEAPITMLIPLIVLVILAFGSGFALFIGDGFYSTINMGGNFEAMDIGERLTEVFTSPLTYLSIVAAVGGILLAYFTFFKTKVSAEKVVSKGFPKAMRQLLLDRYKFPVAYDKIGYVGVYGFSLLLDKFDHYIIDGIVNAISAFLIKAGGVVRKAQTGLIQNYTTLLLLGVSLIIVLLYVVGALR